MNLKFGIIVEKIFFCKIVVFLYIIILIVRYNLINDIILFGILDRIVTFVLIFCNNVLLETY